MPLNPVIIERVVLALSKGVDHSRAERTSKGKESVYEHKTKEIKERVKQKSVRRDSDVCIEDRGLQHRLHRLRGSCQATHPPKKKHHINNSTDSMAHHRKVELQSAADFTYLYANTIALSRRQLDLHLPPSASEKDTPDPMRERVRELVDEVRFLLGL